jgi:formate-dependent nitrite reductase membrane component NrfD
MTNKWESQAQTEWSWYIAAYLFLAGVGAGGYGTGVLASYGGPDWEVVSQIGVALGFPLLAIGTVFLILDLGVKMRALRVFLNPKTSWIARGSLIISIFMILSFFHLVLMVWPGQMSVDAPPLRVIGAVNLIFAVLVMIYTGVLLGASRPIAFWNTAMLPLLFLVSACSTGVMAVLLLTPSDTSPLVLKMLSKADMILLILECIAVVFYIQASHRTDESRASVNLLLKGRLSYAFWVGLIVVGLLVPLALEIYEVTAVAEGDQATTVWLVRTAAVLGLFGGLILRRLVLAAGVRTPLRAAGIEYTFPTSIAR